MRFLLVVLMATTALAQNDDPVARARTLATAGQRAEAIAILEARLAGHPDDRDARTLYGTVLSWNGDYDRARSELQRVLDADPDNADARAALANVDRWSRTRARRELSLGYDYEEFRFDDLTQVHAALHYGMFVARASRGERSDADDQQLEIEAYPRIGKRAYAYLGAAFADGTIYPDWRASAEWFQGFGKGWEGSVGYRRLAFDEDVDLFTASLGKYVGNWLVQGRVYVPEGDTSYQLLARRYFGDDGSYLGIRAGSAREEIRTVADVVGLDQTDVVAEGRYVSAQRWTLSGRAGVNDIGDDGRFTGAVTVGWRF
jgi:YaiO family outer membrane protein